MRATRIVRLRDPMRKASPLGAMVLGVAMLASCAGSERASPAVTAINETLDRFHKAAREADEDTYFSLLSESAVFLGTDATERWTKEEFRAWAEPYFQRESAWDYRPLQRAIGLNRAMDAAWFDETVRNKSYGDLRGTGALILTPDGWRITQYNLTFVIPNDIAPEVVRMTREHLAAQPPAP